MDGAAPSDMSTDMKSESERLKEARLRRRNEKKRRKRAEETEEERAARLEKRRQYEAARRVHPIDSSLSCSPPRARAADRRRNETRRMQRAAETEIERARRIEQRRLTDAARRAARLAADKTQLVDVKARRVKGHVMRLPESSGATCKFRTDFTGNPSEFRNQYTSCEKTVSKSTEANIAPKIDHVSTQTDGMQGFYNACPPAEVPQPIKECQPQQKQFPERGYKAASSVL
ncbi:uncharacterized protein LOC119164514 isoform X3 [Rhipicephalus microplus]|uniref:uncharacterized protein LOC119164514 isoform X3 n=1 Tax=Rhipicephalus microplus TaxID=6941 RepID=UPI003F6C7040